MKYKGTLTGQASGSLGGMTFSHNRGGTYIRFRATPTNPGSPYQEEIRAIVSQLTSLWNDSLSFAERNAWDVYAENTPIKDTLGADVNAGGIAMYNRTNSSRLQCGLSLLNAAPIVFNLGSFTPPSIVAVSNVDQTVSIGFTSTDTWATAVGGYMAVYLSRPQNRSINFFKGPYRLAGVVLGALVAPTSPVEIDVPFTIGAGQKLFAQIRFGQSDGRLSTAWRGFTAT